MNHLRSSTDALSKHMVAEALLVAHYIDAAIRAGIHRDQINATLARVAASTGVSEIWVSDDAGRVEFASVEDSGFAFPTDPASGKQSAPFAALLDGSETVVVQDFGERDLDGARYKYVGVRGVDRLRIVQVGVAADEAG